MAMESELVTAEMVDASEYAELSDSFQVFGVPLTIVNGKGRVEGGMPEPMFVPQVLAKANANPSIPKILIAKK